MSDATPPLPEIEPADRSPWRNLSVIWLVPLLALVVALGIAWQAYQGRGTLIEIRFDDAAGVEAGDTSVRYRNVVIGLVEDVSFSEDLREVIVAARVDDTVLPFLDEDATFWVVRPEISTQGITGLSTVVSGVYIEGAWDAAADTPRLDFEGRSEPLFVLPGDEGRLLTLSVPVGVQLSGGAPVTYRGVQVGRLQDPVLSDDGSELSVDVFIEAPHDQLIDEATRFWDASGFSITLGAQGLTLDVESLASLVTGGIAFDQVFEGAGPAPLGTVFDIFPSEDVARASVFAPDLDGTLPVAVHFSELVPGLAEGVRVERDGVFLGEVTSVQVRAFDTPDGTLPLTVAELAVTPDLVRLGRDVTPDEFYAALAEEVEIGLRAQLISSGLIAPVVRIELDIDYTAQPDVLDVSASPPVIPWVPTPPSTLTTTATGVLERVAALPFEELLDQTIDTLASIEGLAADPSLREIPDEAIALLAEARAIVGDEQLQAIPEEAAAAVADLRAVLSQLNDSSLIPDFVALMASADTVLGQADTAMGPITEASAQLPGIMANLTTLSETAAALEIEAVLASAASAMAGLDAFLSAEGLDEVPANLVTALADLEALTTELRQADVVGALSGTLSAANSAADAANVAAADLPALVARTEAVLGQVSGVLAGYGARSDFMGETMDVLAEITAAARAISQLARTIERNPNALLTGR